jgi:membrane associated rhomboid family serine protease
MELKSILVAKGYDIKSINLAILNHDFGNILLKDMNDETLISSYIIKCNTPMVGASGAVFGIMAAYGYLFPNTELMLLFPPIPIKAKYLISVYFLFELYSSFTSHEGDNVAHLAHVGGAIVGFILVIIWNKNKSTFY